jgi:hypothetical protein
VKIYTHLSDHFASFHSRIVSATASEAPYVLDGLLLHESGLRPREHYTDTGGATDHVFALFHLLGFRFVPRLRDLADKRLGTIRPPATYRGLEPILGRPIRIDAIAESWEEILRLATSIQSGVVAPSTMLRKLSAYKRQNRLDLALAEVGRIERTLFSIDWLESRPLRRRCQAGLNKGEARHRKRRRRLAQDLVGLAQFLVLTLQRLQPSLLVAAWPGTPTGIPLLTANPTAQRLRRAADLRRDRRPLRRILRLVLQHQVSGDLRNCPPSDSEN